jgi:hypothetical protein
MGCFSLLGFDFGLWGLFWILWGFGLGFGPCGYNWTWFGLGIGFWGLGLVNGLF